MLRFLVDAQLPPALADWLRRRGHEALHVRDVMLHTEPDERVIGYAATIGAVVITKDADFWRFSSTTKDLKVVWLRIGYSTSTDLLRRLDIVFGEIEQSLMASQRMIEVRC